MTEKLFLPQLPTSPMFEGSKSVMTVEWQEFFRSLFNRVGGMETGSLDDSITDLVAGTYLTPIDYGKRIDELERKLNSLPALPDHGRRIDDLEIRLNSLPVPKSYDRIIDDLKRTILAQPSESHIGTPHSSTDNAIARWDGISGTRIQNSSALVEDDGTIVLPKARGIGIKVDLATPTFPWRDLKGKVTQRNTGASKPTHAVYRGGLRQYQFAAGKEEYFTYHIDHDHVPDSDIFLHVHWSHISASVTGGTITIEYELSYAPGFNQGAFGAPVSTTYAGTASIVQYQHIISEIQVSAASPSASQIDSNDLEPDGIIEARVKITANNITVSSGGVPDPFIHESDIHYQTTDMGTKQKEPDFYV